MGSSKPDDAAAGITGRCKLGMPMLAPNHRLECLAIFGAIASRSGLSQVDRYCCGESHAQDSGGAADERRSHGGIHAGDARQVALSQEQAGWDLNRAALALLT
jgi:hypothetical protein